MKQLDLENFECNIGLMIREKENHDNYALLRFEDMDKIIEYYNSFKDEFDSKSKGQGK
jgi:hypothetical protein